MVCLSIVIHLHNTNFISDNIYVVHSTFKTSLWMDKIKLCPFMKLRTQRCDSDAEAKINTVTTKSFVPYINIYSGECITELKTIIFFYLPSLNEIYTINVL